jgi:D-glycero-D-manno-heptose 1,7-bisphosphate phosphatase
MPELKRPAAFLDRDGVLNHDRGYTWRAADFEWTDTAARAIRRLNQRGYLVVVVTNQGGIALGLYGDADVEALHRWINETLRPQGAHIDAFYYCPHHSSVGPCDCRKPLPGMLLRAMRELPIDRDSSFMIGDKQLDLEAAKAAGVRGVMIEDGDLDALVRRVIGDD